MQQQQLDDNSTNVLNWVYDNNLKWTRSVNLMAICELSNHLSKFKAENLKCTIETDRVYWMKYFNENNKPRNVSCKSMKCCKIEIIKWMLKGSILSNKEIRCQNKKILWTFLPRFSGWLTNGLIFPAKIVANVWEATRSIQRVFYR